MENSKQIQSGTSRQNIDKQIRNYRRNQTLFVIVSVVINALIIAFLTIYYSIRPGRGLLLEPSICMIKTQQSI